ncbi:hypothetical protein [Phenylobacterium sp.]|jgi:hypothetical protein|uniref:hypothetical protein n=1 Tax=Phenylobacterium sp. TaxID=1871053 RepID=UPI002F4130CA
MVRKRSGLPIAGAVLAAAAAVLLIGLVASSSRASVPAHSPGAVCYTPQFWCWARPLGPPGSPCICPSPSGPVAGVRG